jgi:hypothetical protein
MDVRARDRGYLWKDPRSHFTYSIVNKFGIIYIAIMELKHDFFEQLGKGSVD